MSQINPFEIKDYLAEARSRVTEQFKDKEVFDRYIQLMISSSEEVQTVLKDLMQKRSLDTAQGVQLDILGEIVGQPRTLLDTDLLEYFGFSGYPDVQGFGDKNNPTTGGEFYSFGNPLTGNILLNDKQYRLFIKAKILKNKTNATPNDFLDFIGFVFGTTTNAVIAEGNASFTILIGKELSTFERLLLTYSGDVEGYKAPFIPKPVGVRVNYGQFPADNFFAFAGFPGAQGFGEFVGTFGYGLGYGDAYGDSDFSQTSGGLWASLF